MTQPTRDQIAAALNRVRDPKSGRGVMDAGLVQGLVVREGRVGFMIEVAADMAPLYEAVRAACEKAARSVRGVEAAAVRRGGRRQLVAAGGLHEGGELLAGEHVGVFEAQRA